MWDTAKAVLKGKFIVLSTYIKKERYQINNPSFCVNNQKKKSKTNAKPKRKGKQEQKSRVI